MTNPKHPGGSAEARVEFAFRGGLVTTANISYEEFLTYFSERHRTPIVELPCYSGRSLVDLRDVVYFREMNTSK